MNNTRPEKILFIITKSNFGGAQRYVFELATRLQQQNIPVAVALGGDGELKRRLVDAGIQVFPISGAQRDIDLAKEFKVLFRIYKIVREFKPTIVHLNSPKIGGLGAVATRWASLVNRMFGGIDKASHKHVHVKKILYTNHGWPFNEPRPEWQQILIKIFSWLTVFLGGTTIVLSKTEREDVRTWPLVQRKLVIVPNGVADFEVKKKEDALTALVGKEKAVEWIAEKRLIIGTISELHKNKGLTYALEGLHSYVEQFPEEKIAYIIIGEGELRQSLEEKVKSLPADLQEHVVLAGHVQDARTFISAFDIFLLSSVKEGLPFAILEAGYAEVPVISTSVGGIPELITNLEDGILIPKARPQEIKNALIYIKNHPEVLTQIKTAFKKKIQKTYSFERIFADIKNIYEI